MGFILAPGKMSLCAAPPIRLESSVLGVTQNLGLANATSALFGA